MSERVPVALAVYLSSGGGPGAGNLLQESTETELGTRSLDLDPYLPRGLYP